MLHVFPCKSEIWLLYILTQTKTCASTWLVLFDPVACAWFYIWASWQIRVTHAPRMPATFSSPQRISDPDMTHVPWCMPGSLTSGFLRSLWQEKRSRHSRRMRNPVFGVSGKRPRRVIVLGRWILQGGMAKIKQFIAPMGTKTFALKIAYITNCIVIIMSWHN